MQHVELAEKLGIKKQNINMWIKGKQNIPQKYLPVLEDLFGLEKAQHEVIFHKTIEALAHYYEVLPDWVASEQEQEEFEEDIFEVFDYHNF